MITKNLIKSIIKLHNNKTYDGDVVGDGWPFEKSNLGFGFFCFFPEINKITLQLQWTWKPGLFTRCCNAPPSQHFPHQRNTRPLHYTGQNQNMLPEYWLMQTMISQSLWLILLEYIAQHTHNFQILNYLNF